MRLDYQILLKLPLALTLLAGYAPVNSLPSRLDQEHEFEEGLSKMYICLFHEHFSLEKLYCCCLRFSKTTILL